MNQEEDDKVEDFMKISKQLTVTNLLDIIRTLVEEIENRIENGKLQEKDW